MMKQKKKRSRQFKDESRVALAEDPREKRRSKREEKIQKSRKSEKKSNSKRRTSRVAKRRLIYTTIILIIIVVSGVSALNVYNLMQEEESVKKEHAELLKEKEKLEYELEQINSLEYIEQQARQLLRMIKPGEILYVLPENEDASGQAEENESGKE